MSGHAWPRVWAELPCVDGCRQSQCDVGWERGAHASSSLPAGSYMETRGRKLAVIAQRLEE